jgi:hypothetical protein
MLISVNAGVKLYQCAGAIVYHLTQDPGPVGPWVLGESEDYPAGVGVDSVVGARGRFCCLLWLRR